MWNVCKYLLVIFTVALSPITTFAEVVADSGYKSYYGLGTGKIRGSHFDTNSIDFLAGFDLNQAFAFEGHFGVTDQEAYEMTQASGQRTQTRLDYYSSLSLRANLRRNKLRAYAFLGFTTVHQTLKLQTPLSGNATSYTTKETANGFVGICYGVGLDLFGNRNTALYLHIGKLLAEEIDDAPINIDQILVGFRYFLNDRGSYQRIPSRLRL